MKPPGADIPVVVNKWYGYAKWALKRVESFPKSQRFILGQRLSNHVTDMLELLVAATLRRFASAKPALDKPRAESMDGCMFTKATWRFWPLRTERQKTCLDIRHEAWTLLPKILAARRAKAARPAA